MRRLLCVVAILLFHLAHLYAQTGEITGRVTDEKGEGLPFANVIAEQDGKLVTGAQTDFDGYFVIKPLDPGKYDVKVSYLGEDKSVTKGVGVSGDKITELNLSITQQKLLGEVKVIEYRVPLIDKENNSTKQTITSEEIKSLPTKNINSIASLSAGVYQSDEGQGLNVKGARESGTQYIIDGVKVRGSAKIPAQGIEELTVITGGVPAKYGDATGGIISITTRGPARNFSGSIEGVTSQGMDAYGYNLGSFDLTGPIYTKNKGKEGERTVLGFFIAGEYLRQEDASPSAVGVYTAKEDTLNYLEQNPLTPSSTSDAFIVTTETVTKDGIENVETKPNVVNNNYTLSGKLDAKVTDAITLTFGGNYNYTNRHDWVDRYTMFNYVNNPLYKETTWRVFGRFTQRFGQKAPTEDSGTPEKKSAFQNAFYSVQFDYTKVYDKFEDDSHGFSPFDYGYIGTYDILKSPVFAYGLDSVSGKSGWRQAAIQDTLVRFAPANVNPTGTAFPNSYYQLAGAVFQDGWWTAPYGGAQTGLYQTLSQIQGNNALLNGDRPRQPHDIWYNTGRQFNGYGYSNNDDQYRLSVLGSVDIVPGGSARNKHAIEFGFEFEQRIDRGYSVGSIGLWELMRQLANFHIDQLDTENPYLLIDGEVYNYDDPNAPAFGQNDTILYGRKYVAGQQYFFDKSLRTKLGLAENNTDFINIDSLPPSFFSLDMFSADELLNGSNPSYVAYFGYDYLGNKLSSQPSFDDFFKEKDANGNYTRAIGAFRPIYTSAFIQDKFNFKDLLFNIGLRVDRFDANQKVLRDPYLLYQAYTVGESRTDLDGTVPANIGDDYVVYVDDFSKNNPVPVGYRNGDTWYTSDGTETNDPRVISTASASGAITPYLVKPNDDIKSEDFDPSTSFKDYEPQITVMPRLAFSFNITDEASFFAHYDILTQRPLGSESGEAGRSIIMAPPDQWYFFDENISGVLRNPALKPERTIDYQLGFRQLITQNSAVTVSAFYREMKDMIQVVNMAYAYPRDYRTFGNVDFGTVKGFSIAYDLRNTGTSNFAMRLNYTIQFAEGTGSNTTSQINLVGAGQPNLRTIVPLDYDSRHNINVTLDYSYGEGENYNGPKIKGKQIFANAGINLNIRARSGEPFTQQENPTAEALIAQSTRKILTGSINGSRLPWNFKVDFRVWKDFRLNNFKKKAETDAVTGEKKTYYLNVYLQIQNLLNTLNINSIYPYTGNADDDGYLTSTLGQQDVSTKENAESYNDLYRAYLDSGMDEAANSNSGRYSLPRSIRIGAIFKF